MYGNGCVSECLYNAILVRRLWTVEKDVSGLTCNVRDNDIIKLHVSVSPAVSLGSCWIHPERVIVEAVRKGIVVGKCCIMCWTHLQMFFCQYCPRREVLRRGTGLSSICQASRPSPTATLKRTWKQRHHVWWVELFVCAGLSWCISCTLSQMFSVRTVLGDKTSEVEQVPSFLKVAHQHTEQEEEQ